MSMSMYECLSVAARSPAAGPDDPPPPDTTLTATIETIDNDRAYMLLPGIGFS
jgi:hypothetical protein